MILAIFSLIILMPLIWIARVSFTDKLTAYKIPPEIGTLGLMNYVEIFQRFPFVTWFTNSLVVALLATLIALPFATAMAYAFARINTGGAFLRLGVLASQMLPPIILVLPLFGVFSSCWADTEPHRACHRASHHFASVPRLDARVFLPRRRRTA